MQDNILQKYNRRLEDYNKTLSLKEPSEILIHADILTGQIGYYGLTIRECLNDTENYIKTCTKLYEDFKIDFVCNPLINPMEAIEALGRDTFFISEDGVTIQHTEDAPMRDDEYDLLINNPMVFMLDTLGSRKFSVLSGEITDDYDKFKKAAAAYKKFMETSSAYINYAKENYGVLSVNAAKSYAPLDVIFDRLRGFEGTLKDIRRYPEKIKEACDSLLDIYIKPLDKLTCKIPHALTTIHCPTYLRNADFEKYYMPTYKQMLLRAFENGSTTLIDLEGNIKRFYDYFLELPAGCVALMVGDEDIYEAADILNNKIPYFGNFSLSMMKYSTTRECLDEAKRMCDKCAPGGGFVFCSDLPALSTSDMNAVNMSAVYNFVKEYK